jgi:hypothetical protein
MNKNRFSISNTIGIAVMLLLIGGIGTTSTIFSTAHAQTPTLGKPFFVEKGENTSQKEIGPNKFTFTSNGTMNGNIEVTDSGEFVTVSRGNNVTYDQGQGVIATKDGSETANYTFIDIGNGKEFLGASIYNTNSTGKLFF